MANNPALTAYVNMVMRFGWLILIAERDEKIRQLEARIDTYEKVMRAQRQQRKINGLPVTVTDAYFARKLQVWASDECSRAPARERPPVYAYLGDSRNER